MLLKQSCSKTVLIFLIPIGTISWAYIIKLLVEAWEAVASGVKYVIGRFFFVEFDPSVDEIEFTRLFCFLWVPCPFIPLTPSSLMYRQIHHEATLVSQCDTCWIWVNKNQYVNSQSTSIMHVCMCRSIRSCSGEYVYLKPRPNTT